MAIYKKQHKRTGVEFYYIRFRLADGRRKKEKAGTTKRQAEKLLKVRLGEVASGTYKDPRARKASHATFRKFSVRFLKDYGDQRRSEYYRGRVKVLNAHLGDRALDKITRNDIEAFALQRARVPEKGRKKPAGASTIRKELIVLGTMFKMAVRWGLLEHNPATDIDKPREPKYDERYLFREEYQRLRDGAPPWLRPMYRMAVVTGLRLKEVVSLRWDGIDREAGLLHIGADNKTATPRTIPLGEVAGAVLGGQVRHMRSPYVFLDAAGKPYTSGKARNRISKETRALMKSLGIQGASFKTLRDTAASWAAQAGESGVAIGQFLGHAAQTMTDRYMHLNPTHLAGIVSALDRAEQGGDPQTAPQVLGTVENVEAKVVN